LTFPEYKIKLTKFSTYQFLVTEQSVGLYGHCLKNIFSTPLPETLKDLYSDDYIMRGGAGNDPPDPSANPKPSAPLDPSANPNPSAPPDPSAPPTVASTSIPTAIPLAVPDVLPPTPPPPPQPSIVYVNSDRQRKRYQVGDKVEFKLKNEWKNGKITKRRPDGTYDVSYGDNKVQTGLTDDDLFPFVKETDASNLAYYVTLKLSLHKGTFSSTKERLDASCDAKWEQIVGKFKRLNRENGISSEPEPTLSYSSTDHTRRRRYSAYGGSKGKTRKVYFF
jgi:hypothetical protein